MAKYKTPRNMGQIKAYEKRLDSQTHYRDTTNIGLPSVEGIIKKYIKLPEIRAKSKTYVKSS